MKKRIIILLTSILALGALGYWYTLSSVSGDLVMFSTQAECERKTGKNCSNDIMCDYNCPKGFHKGWWMPSVMQRKCADIGEQVGAQDLPDACCSGLKPLGGHPGGYTGDCAEFSAPGGVLRCSACGNNVCDVATGENKCNCSEDCQ